MQLEAYRASWGLVELGDDEALLATLPGLAAAGWDGVAVATQAVQDHERLRDALAGNGLAIVPQVFTFGDTLEDHLGWVRTGLERAASYRSRVVIGQLGTDHFSDDEAVSFLRDATSIADDLGVNLAQETHRGRPLFHPHRSLRLLEQAERVRLNADLAHWTVSAESLSWGDDVVAMVAARSIHIDARVGSEEWPQVDPRDLANERLLEAFETWWRAIFDARAADGDGIMGFTPEYGPPPYQAGPDDPVERAAIVTWARDRMRDVAFTHG